MPLTDLQRQILALIGPVRAPESYVVGGTVPHFQPNLTRFSRDLDVFRDALASVANAYAEDARLLRDAGFELDTIISQPGFIRAIAGRRGESTQIDWARDSSWRFMPVRAYEIAGYVLHDIDIATNWLTAIEAAEAFVRSRPMSEAGCLYYHDATGSFVEPDSGSALTDQGIVTHFGRAGGVLQRPAEDSGARAPRSS